MSKKYFFNWIRIQEERFKFEYRQPQQIRSVWIKRKKKQITGIEKKIKFLINLESLKKASLMMTSSRRDTDRKLKLNSKQFKSLH
jgi:hypothetical protein